MPLRGRIASLCMCTAYHPESDGQTEVHNCVLKQYLRAFVHGRPSNWYKFLALAKWSYNTYIHTSIGFSSFEVTYDKPPSSISQYLRGSTTIEAVDSLMATCNAIHANLQS